MRHGVYDAQEFATLLCFAICGLLWPHSFDTAPVISSQVPSNKTLIRPRVNIFDSFFVLISDQLRRPGSIPIPLVEKLAPRPTADEILFHIDNLVPVSKKNR